jgi:hypothetical protein
MSDHLQSNTEKSSNEHPIWLSFLSTLLGCAAFWYAWLRFTNLLGRSDTNWYEWIQPSLVFLFGLMSLGSAVLFILRKADASSYFKLGLAIIPLTLFINLLILLFRAVTSLWQGNAGFLLERVLSQPQKFILILVIIIALIMLDRLNNSENAKNK